MIKNILPKFKFKADPIVLNAPSEFTKDCLDLGFLTRIDLKNKSANALVFVQDKKMFIHFLKMHLNEIEYDAVLWFAYPKGMSGLKTDINRDILWEIGEKYGVTTVAAISISDVWSELRFRTIDRVGIKCF